MSVASTITGNAIGSIRREYVDGRLHLVAPMTMIVPGVLPGSKGPLYYPPDEVAKSIPDWNGVPIVVYHPTDPITNAPLSASDDGVWDRQGIGVVKKAKMPSGKLVAEGWYDAEKTRAVDPRVYDALMSGKPMELSTGLFTDNDENPGIDPKGRPYEAIARNYRPDHLAVLPDQEGACSKRDGCGVLINRRAVSSNPASVLNEELRDKLGRWASSVGSALGLGKMKTTNPKKSIGQQIVDAASAASTFGKATLAAVTGKDNEALFPKTIPGKKKTAKSNEQLKKERIQKQKNDPSKIGYAVETHETRVASMVKHVNDARRAVAAVGKGPDLLKGDISANPALRALGVKDPAQLNRVLSKVETSLKQAVHFGAGPALIEKVQQIDKLRKAVSAFHSSQAMKAAGKASNRTEQFDSVLPDHYATKGAGHINISHAIAHLTSGGTPQSAVAHVMKKGGLEESTAKSYVRKAVKKMAAASPTTTNTRRLEITDNWDDVENFVYCKNGWEVMAVNMSQEDWATIGLSLGIVENASVNQPRHPASGQWQENGSGTGDGDTHDATREGFAGFGKGQEDGPSEEEQDQEIEEGGDDYLLDNEGVSNMDDEVDNEDTLNEILNCGGKGGTKGPCKAGTKSAVKQANAASRHADTAQHPTAAHAVAAHKAAAAAHTAAAKAMPAGSAERAAHVAKSNEHAAKADPDDDQVNPDHLFLDDAPKKSSKKATKNQGVRNMSSQHTASKEACNASIEHGPAREPAMNALDASSAGDSSTAASSHVQAAKIHEKAATNARMKGKNNLANLHDNAAALHRKAASMHTAVTTNGSKFGVGPSAVKPKKVRVKKVKAVAPPAMNDDESDEPAMNDNDHSFDQTDNEDEENTTMNRSTAMEMLVDNCSCQEDKAALNNLSDETLIQLAQNASGMRKEAAVALNADDDDDEDDDDDSELEGDDEDDDDDSELEDNARHPSTGQFVAKNRGKKKPATMNQLLANMSQQDREIWNQGQQALKSQKMSIVRRLVANVAEKHSRQNIGKWLLNKPLKELQVLGQLVPQPVENSHVYSNRFQIDEQRQESFLGAADIPTFNETVGQGDDDVLPLPMMNGNHVGSE